MFFVLYGHLKLSGSSINTEFYPLAQKIPSAFILHKIARAAFKFVVVNFVLDQRNIFWTFFFFFMERIEK